MKANDTALLLLSLVMLAAPSWGSLDLNVARLRVKEIREAGGVLYLSGMTPEAARNPEGLIWSVILEEFGDLAETGEKSPWVPLDRKEDLKPGDVVAGIGWDGLSQRTLFFSGVNRGVGTQQLEKFVEASYVIETTPPLLLPNGSSEPGRAVLIGIFDADFFRLDSGSNLFARRARQWDPSRRDAIAFGDLRDVEGERIATRRNEVLSQREWEREGKLSVTVQRQWRRFQDWVRSIRRARTK